MLPQNRLTPVVGASTLAHPLLISALTMTNPPRNETSHEDIPDLAIAVEQLTEETRILRQSLDELRDDVVWAARQVLSAGEAVSPNCLPRRPRDPLAPDAFSPEEVESRADHEVQAGDRPQENRDAAETTEYCCDSPRLAWNGDPDYPGVACENCGYVVAELGSLVILQTDDEPPEPSEAEPHSSEQQAQLF